MCKHSTTGTHRTTAHSTIAPPTNDHTSQTERLKHTTNVTVMISVISSNNNNSQNSSETRGNKGAHLHHGRDVLVTAKTLT